VEAKQHERWMNRPYGDEKNGEAAVDENLLTPVKATYTLFARCLDPKLIKDAYMLRPKRLEPSAANFGSYCQRLSESAHQRPTERILSIQFFACHGYCKRGM